VKSSRGLSPEIIKILVLEPGKAEQTSTDLAQKPVREHLAELLLFLKETYGFGADGATLNVVLSWEDIANLVGTATETAIRMLSELRRDGIVEFAGKKIRLLDQTRLVKAANMCD
jgi:CRP-like cAMP-binding protein